MALELLNRPQGYKLTESSVTGTAYDDGTGLVQIVTTFAHGLIDGDHVLIESNISSYNGFVEVDSVAYNTFKIISGGTYIEFIQSVGISYRVAVLAHGWQCVHLPIVYELKSDLFPNNIAEESYLPNTVASFSNSNGCVRLNLTQALSDPTELAKIELVGEGPVSGVYQILTVFQPWSVVIDLVYNASYSFSGYVIVKYYDNYAINVEVYAGLEAGHRWESMKPFELAATLRFIPDIDGKSKFSINEVLRGYIQTRNKLDLDTLPNNLDFMTEFYVRYYETYDISDGEEITTFVGIILTDTFVGQAVNAKLPFKNIYSGHLSDYINEDAYLGKWLTLFARPVAIVGRFFDISFLLQYSDIDVQVTISKSLEGNIIETEVTMLDNPGLGVIRVPLEISSGFDQYCVQAATPGVTGGTVAMIIPPLSTWLTQSINPSYYDWTTGAAPTVNLPGAGELSPALSEKLYTTYAFVEGLSYDITISSTRVVNSGTAIPRTNVIEILNNSFVTREIFFFAASAGSNSNNIVFVAGSDYTKIAFWHSSGSDVDITINSVSGTVTIESIPAQTLTEQLCIPIIEECDDTHIPDDIRLTEDGNFRILE